jgi:hypothetical protein
MTIDQNPVQETNVGEMLTCANHPNTETLLRCNRCNKPICMKCAVQTDVGYRCKECIREVQDKYYTAETKDNWIALGVSFLVTVIAAPILGFFLGFFGFFFGTIIAILVGGSAGTMLSQIIRRAVGGRRGRNMRWFALAGIILGVLVAILFTPFPLLNIPTLVFAVLASTTALSFLR